MKSAALGWSTLVFLVACSVSGSPALARTTVDWRKAQAVLKTHCHRCHGKDGTDKGGFHYVLDRDKLLARNKVVPGKPAASEIYKRAAAGEMPPPEQKLRPDKNDLTALEQWIAAVRRRFTRRRCAANAALRGRHPRAHPGRPASARAHGSAASCATSRLSHLANAGPRREGPAARPAGPGKRAQQPLLAHGPHRAAGRRSGQDRLPHRPARREMEQPLVGSGPGPVSLSPAGQQHEAKAIATHDRQPSWHTSAATGSVATASRPPLYHDLLQLPGTDRATGTPAPGRCPGEHSGRTVSPAPASPTPASRETTA